MIVLLRPVDGLNPSSWSLSLARAFSSVLRKRDFVRSGMSGKIRNPLDIHVSWIFGQISRVF